MRIDGARCIPAMGFCLWCAKSVAEWERGACESAFIRLTTGNELVDIVDQFRRDEVQ